METFTVEDFATLFCPDIDQEGDLDQKLRDHRLIDPILLTYLMDVWQKSMRKWIFQMDLYVSPVLKP